MYLLLKHTHMTLVLLAIVVFILCFFWLKTGHKNAQKVLFKKILLHTHLTIAALGLALMWLLHFNPFDTYNFWLLEKIFAFVVYLGMVQIALNEKTKPHIQWLTFLGAFGWLIYIAKLAITKQAILL